VPKKKVLTDKLVREAARRGLDFSKAFRDYTAIDDAAAWELARHARGPLSLRGLTELSVPAAAALSTYHRRLSLNGLLSLSDKAAQALSAHRGFRLHLKRIAHLSDAAAHALSAHRGEIYLKRLERLSDSPGHLALAKKLASQKSSLYFHSLAEIAPAAAKELSKHKNCLTIEGLGSLSDAPGHLALAKKLTANPDDLWLDCVTHLSDAAARQLSKHKKWVSLRRLKVLHDSPGHHALARKLAKGDDNDPPMCTLNGLTHLTVAVARLLTTGKDTVLNLRGLSTLSPDVAAVLGSFKGYGILLDGLSKLSLEAAHALSRFRGLLSLDGLRTISSSTAQALAKHSGELLYLNGVNRISEPAALALAKHRGGGVSLDGVRQLSVATARAFANGPKSLYMWRLRVFSDDVVEALAGFQGETFSVESLISDDYPALARNRAFVFFDSDFSRRVADPDKEWAVSHYGGWRWYCADDCF